MITKNIIPSISLITFLLALPILAFTQFTREDYIKEEQNRIDEVRKGFDVFLNTQLSDGQRINAVESFPTVNDEGQLPRVKRIVRNREESDEVRAMAMAKLSYHTEQDESLYKNVLDWVVDPNTPKLLRLQTLNTLGLLGFTPFGMQAVGDDIISTYRKLVNDNEIEYRRTAFNYLAVRGDDFAQQLLIQGLQNPQQSLLPSSESIAMLSFDIHGDHYPVIFKVMQETNEKATLIEAIRVLGNYAPARPEIIKYLNDQQEDREVRLSAMKTLNAFDQDNFARNVLPLIRNRNTPEELVIYAINAEKYRRKSNRVRNNKIVSGQFVGDSFDQAVQQLNSNSESNSPVGKSANIYLRTLNLN